MIQVFYVYKSFLLNKHRKLGSSDLTIILGNQSYKPFNFYHSAMHPAEKWNIVNTSTAPATARVEKRLYLPHSSACQLGLPLVSLEQITWDDSLRSKS